MADSQDLAIPVKQRNDEAEAEGHPVVKTAHYPQEPNSSMSSNRFSAAWLGESYTIAITIPLKQQRTRSTAITLNETNTFRQRAGHKIWGQERVQNEFHESNNCKDPLYWW